MNWRLLMMKNNDLPAGLATEGRQARLTVISNIIGKHERAFNQKQFKFALI